MWGRAPWGNQFWGGIPNGSIPLSDSDSTQVDTETESVGVGTEAAEALYLDVEGDKQGWNGTWGSAPWGGLPWGGAQRIVGQDWSIHASFTDAEATQPIGETSTVIERIDLDLSNPGASFVSLVESPLAMTWQLNQRATCTLLAKYPGVGYYAPRAGHQVRIKGLDGSVWFEGSVEKPKKGLVQQLTLTGPTNRLNVTCPAVGWERIADRFYASDPAHQVYTDQNLDVIAADLINTYLAADGVTATGLPTGVLVSGTVTFNYLMTISACLTELSKRTGYWWRIEAGRVLKFYASGTAGAAALSITASSGNWVSVDVVEDLSTYRNRQYLTNVWLSVSPPAESFAGDSKRTTFTVAYQLLQVPTITLNGSSQTVGIKGVDTGKQWYWNQGSADVVQDSSGTVLVSTDTLTITYVGQAQQVRSVTDATEIAARQAIEGGSGIYEDAQGDGTVLTTADSADAYAQALIDRNAPPPTVVSIVADTTGAMPAWPGQYVPINLPDLNLNGNFFVSQVSAQMVNKGERARVTITASSNEPQESWQAALQRKAPATDMTGLAHVAS